MLKCTKFDFRWGSTPDPLAGFKAPTSKGREAKMEGRGRMESGEKKWGPYYYEGERRKRKGFAGPMSNCFLRPCTVVKAEKDWCAFISESCVWSCERFDMRMLFCHTYVTWNIRETYAAISIRHTVFSKIIERARWAKTYTAQLVDTATIIVKVSRYKILSRYFTWDPCNT